MGRELEDVEKPFVAQLQALGWSHVEGSLDDPAITDRASFAEVIQKRVLRAVLTNTSLRERFEISEGNSAQASRIIAETVEARLIKPANPDNKSRRLMQYLPFWA